MENTIDKVRNYINALQRNRAESEEFEALFDSPFDDTILVLSDQGEYNAMKVKTKEMELFTIISLKDNPKLNLNVAQPCKYKISSNGFATGIMCYKENALELLKKQLQQDEKIIQITVQISEDKVLNLLGYSNKKYLKQVYETISEDVKKQLIADKDFIDYVWKNGKRKIDMIVGMTVLGGSIYPTSAIYDYMDYAFIIKNRDIIKSAKEI